MADGTVTSVLMTASAAALAPTLPGDIITISALAARAGAAAEYTSGAGVSVSAGVDSLAAAAAAAGTPTVSGSAHITGALATAAAAASAPTVTVANVVNAVAATAVADAGTPVITTPHGAIITLPGAMAAVASFAAPAVAATFAPPNKRSQFDLTLQLSMLLQNTYTGEATGGSGSTVIIDTNNDAPAGYFSDAMYPGTVWIPFYRTTHLVTTHTLNNLTISPGYAATIPVGLDYYAAPTAFPRWQLRQAINRALRDIGEAPFVTTVVAVAYQESYTWNHDGVFAKEIRKVEVATSLAAPYNFQEHFGWYQEKDMTFHFFPGYAPGDTYLMRITYLEPYIAPLETDLDECFSTIDVNLVLWTAAVNALRWKVQLTKSDDQTYIGMLNEALKNSKDLLAKHKRTIPDKITHSRW